ncbi:MAG: glycoside hydrolase family 3 C-terminal domain-containing protein, partial [Christensenellales bacterium]
AMAAESTVLLKNQDILPLRSGDTVAVIGEFALSPRTQGNGSSHTVPYKQDNLADELKLLMGGGVEYAQGYSTLDSKPSARLEDQAVGLALRQDKVVLMLGLPDSWESESFDRTHMNLPENQLRLLEKLSAANKNIIAVLVNGSPVDLSALGGCKAVIEGYLGGAASGGALADVLYGVVNPSGRLAETLPLNIQNTPAYQNFGGPEREIEYKEDIFVGYRHYGTRKVPVAYPFGYGLSYTQFGYSALKLKDDLDGRGELTVNFQLQNTGSYAGKEAVQIYVRPPADMPVACAERELKQFAKVSLRPKESQTVSLTLRREDFAYFDEKSESWRVHGGEYTIIVGKNSLESALEKTLHITEDPVRRAYFTEENTLGELAQDADGKKFIDFMVENFRRPGQGIDIAAEEGSTEQRFFYTTALKLLPPASDGALSASALQFIINAINKKGWRLRLLSRFMAKQKKRIELEAQLKEQQADYRQISEDAPPAETAAEILPQTENAPQPVIQTENAAADNDSAGHDLAEPEVLDLNIGDETQNTDIATEYAENFADTDGAADTAPDFTDTDNIQESQTALDNADNAAETDIILPGDSETIDKLEAVPDTQSEQQAEQTMTDSQNGFKQPESDE